MKALKRTCPVVLVSCLALGQGAEVNRTPAAQAQNQGAALRTASPARLAIERMRLYLPQFGPNKNIYSAWHLEFRNVSACKNFELQDSSIITRFDKWADLLVPNSPALWAKLEADRSIREAEISWPMIVPPPPPSKEKPGKSKETPDAIVRGGIGKGADKITGKGVIIVIVDTGLDFSHPDFVITADGKRSSRLLYFWDTLDNHGNVKTEQEAPAKYPNGAPFGALFTRDELTRQLQANSDRLRGWDLDGHGTACASIAAGNNQTGGPSVDGNKHLPVGVAPDADLIAVRIGRVGEMVNAYLLGRICEWVNEVARKEHKPAVISCSFGGRFGARDGNGVLERQLNARFDKVPGRALCLAAGNDGYFRLHGQAEFSDQKKGVLEWTPRIPVVLSLYFHTDQLDDLVLEYPGTEESNIIQLEGINRIRKFAEIHVKLGGGQRGELHLRNRKRNKVVVNAYVFGAEFSGSCSVPREQINFPGTISNAITVGSYDWNDNFHREGRASTEKVTDRTRQKVEMKVGALSAYSNPGYSRNETNTVKPDLVAPGQFFSAAAAVEAIFIYTRDTSGQYLLFNGTSAATPYTAGVIALIMQKNPHITVQQLKKLFQDHCTKDNFTGDKEPNFYWGRGKLNYKAVVQILGAL